MFSNDEKQFQRSSLLPELQGASPSDSLFLRKNIEITDEMSKQKHPLEYLAEDQRARENPYSRMQENSLLITNFPSDVKITKEYIQTLCQQKDPQAIINKIDLQLTFSGQNQFDDNILRSNKVAYAIVQFEDYENMINVRRGLRKEWVNDKLLKVRTLEDKNLETHGLRTIIIQNIPLSVQPIEIAKAMSKFGAITHIECPKINQYLQAQNQGKDYYSKQRKSKREQEYRLAQLLVQESKNLDNQMESIINQEYDEGKADEVIQNYKNVQNGFEDFNMLDQQKFNSFVRIMTKLQSEGITIESSKASFKTMKRDLKIKSNPQNIDNTLQNQSMPQQQDTVHLNVEEIMQGKEEMIEKTLRYLLSNQENLDASQIEFLQQFVNKQQNIDPIHKLQRMSLEEITHSYDVLLSILKQRETVIKKRLLETVKHFGMEERILHESNNFNKDQESMPEILLRLYKSNNDKIDRYLSINEQIENVKMYKNVPAQEKLYQWFTDTTTISDELNFNYNQLAYANTNEFNDQRELMFPKTNVTKSDLINQGKIPQPFQKNLQKQIEQKVQKVRKETDLPYDETYHKEKKLIQDIIRAQQSIKQIEDSLPNPASEYKIDSIDLQQNEQSKLYEIGNESQFLKDKKFQNKLDEQTSLQNQIESDIYENQNQFAYEQQTMQSIQQMIASGQISRQQFEQAQAQHLLNQDINMGYAFITFSHADEALQTILLTQSKLIFDNSYCHLMIKKNLDHSQIDKSYFMKKMENESKIVEQKQEFREANQKLRDFERVMDKELPNQIRLKEFKSIAQEILENPSSRTRRHSSQRRSKREQQELYDKMQDIQKQNPNVDLTQLFENEKMERMRKEMHKRAFINYKKFEFLKVGLFTEEQKKDHKKQQMLGSAQENDIFEPFNYPPLKNAVQQILIDGIQAKINIPGEQIKNKGRKFQYTDKDFLEAYLGKDYMSRVDLSQNEYIQTFGFHESIKELIPDKSQYLVLDKIKKNRQRLEDFFGTKSVDGEYLDPEFARLLQGPEASKIFDQILSEIDVRDINDKNKTMLGELNKKLAVLKKKQENAGQPGLLPMREMKNIFFNTIKEFQTPFRKDLKLSDEILNQQIQEQQEIQKLMEEKEQSFKQQIENMNQIDPIQKEKNEQHIIDLLSKSKQFKSKEEIQQQIKKMNDENLQDDFETNELLNKFSEQDQMAVRDIINSLKNQNYVKKVQDTQEFTDDEFYEKKSIFRPFSTNQNNKNNKKQQKPEKKDEIKNENIKQNEQKPQKNEQINTYLEFNPLSLLNDQRNRISNENAYNIIHLENNQSLNIISDEIIGKYQKLANQITKQRREEFDKLKKEQLLLEPGKRTSYYIDSNDNLKPFTKEMIELSKQKKVKIPKNVPNYEQFKQGVTMESIVEQNAQDETIIEDQSQKNDINEEILEDLELQEEQKRNQIFDILNLNANEAIKEVTISDVLKMTKGQIIVDESFDQNQGQMNIYQKTFMDEQDLAKHQFRENVGVGRQLDQFVDENNTSKDIYEQYKEQMQNESTFEKIRVQSLQDKQDAKLLNQIYSEAEKSSVKVPQLDQYFEQSAQNKNLTDLFESLDYDNQVQQEEFERIIDEKDDESKYRQELLARMFGGKLTSRQYRVLLRMSEDDREQARLQKENQQKNHHETKVQIRNAEELLERYRRNMVHTGQWKEQESHQYLQSMLDEIEQKYPTKTSFDIAMREFEKNIEQVQQLRNSEQMQEREYYFDEGLGQSLNDHIKELKDKFPKITIHSRRDRDGFPIVKISMKHQYQYKIDDIINLNPENLKQIQLDTQETILNVFMPENPKEFIKQVGQLTLQNQNADSIYDQRTLNKLNILVRDKFNGKYQNHEEFERDCKQLKKEFENKTHLHDKYDLNQEDIFQNTNVGLGFNKLERNIFEESIFNEILQDQEKFDFDIQHQLKMKIQDKQLFTKREKSDYVKVSQSETRIFRKQVSRLDETIQILEKDNEWLLKAGEKPKEEETKDFDRDKFNKLKMEIKQRKEAKQKILNQGFPEFQAYSRL